MTNIFIIHGAYGNPDENWFPYLKKELKKLGHKVFIPEFPTPKHQNLGNWRSVFVDYLPLINEESIFIGHSLGPAFIFDILSQIDIKIKASYFVSPFLDLLGNDAFDTINQSFVKNPKINFDKINQNCKKFYIYHSDNDPYVPLKKAQEVADLVNSEINIIKNAGHFNSQSGYDEFEKLLEDIKKELD